MNAGLQSSWRSSSLKTLLLCGLLSCGAPAQADDAGNQRGAVLGNYLLHTSVIDALIAGYCPQVIFRSLKAGHQALEQERPYISPAEYAAAKKYIDSDGYRTGVKDMTVALSGGISEGVEQGMDRGTSCGLTVGVFVGTAKTLKNNWDAIKNRR